jgi:hypothetical protein
MNVSKWQAVLVFSKIINFYCINLNNNSHSNNINTVVYTYLSDSYIVPMGKATLPWGPII